MSQTEPRVSWPQVVKFVGQLTHDLRNHLNATELQAAFLGEIVESSEAKAEVMRLREMTAGMSEQLQRLSAQLCKIQPSPMPYGGSELIEDLRARVAKTEAERAGQIEWEIQLGDAAVEIDPHLMLDAFAELIDNALTHKPGAPIIFRACAEGDALIFTLREPKTVPVEIGADWGAAPLAQLRHGHYALGLVRARSIFEAHHGTFQAHFDPSGPALVTTVTLPRAKS